MPSLTGVPLVEPLYKSVPEFAVTDGDLAGRLGEQLGLTPDGEQQMILDAVFASDEAGRPAFFEVGVVAPRQNLKTACLQIIAMADLLLFGEELVIWTAHLYETAQKSFQGMRRLIELNPDLREQFKWPPRTANGQECFELLTGQRLEFHARSKGGGRGFSADKIILDEALILSEETIGALLPTLATRANAQVRYASSSGLVTSSILRAVRDRGRVGQDGLAYFEWSAPVVDCASPDCLHVRGTDGCALDRVDLWAQANPALGRRISKSFIEKMRGAMPPAEFAREFLGWWEDPSELDAGFPLAVWQACSSEIWAPRGDLVLSVDVAQERGSAAIVAASYPDGNPATPVVLEVVDHSPGTDWVMGRVLHLWQAHSPRAVVIDGRSQAASFVDGLKAAGVNVVVMQARDMASACGGFHDAVTGNTLRVRPNAGLDAAVAGASKRVLGDAWAWSKKDSSIDITPLVAVTAAHWVASGPAPSLENNIW